MIRTTSVIIIVVLFGTVMPVCAQQLKWEKTLEASILSSPAIGKDGTIYIGAGRKLYALNPDGSEQWAFNAGDKIWSSPAIDEGNTIYIGCFDKYLYAINSNGTLKWKFPVTTESCSPAIDKDGNIYIGSHGFYSVDPGGNQRWYFPTHSSTSTSPAVSNDGTIYVVRGGSLSAVHSDGTLKWGFEAGGWIHSSPAVDTDLTIYTGADDGYLYAINHVGFLKWKFYVGAEMYSSAVIGEDGTIYIGAHDGYLYAINRNGIQKWKFGTDHRVYGSPAVAADGTIYVGSYDHNFYAVNPDGTEKWRYRTGDGISSSPAIASDGTIYIGSHDRKVYAFEDAGHALANASWPKFRRHMQNTGSCVHSRPWPILPQEQAHPIFTNYGEFQPYGYHAAVDIYGDADDSEIVAPADAVITSKNSEPGSKYNSIRLRETGTNERFSWRFGHIEHESIAQWNVGDVISKGEVLGRIVQWHSAEGDHIHYQLEDEAAPFIHREHPLLYMHPRNDPAPPFFEHALPGSQFAFCRDEMDFYLNASLLQGKVDIVARVSDDYRYKQRFPQSNDRVTPYLIWFQIENAQGEIVYGPLTTITFQGVFWATNEGTFDVLYKDDATCNSNGRDFYFVLTNTDGDGYPELEDAEKCWNTEEIPNGNYTIRCWAADFSNVTEAVQTVTVINP